MRILLLNQFFPPDTAATGQLLGDVAVGLAGGGHEVHVICSAGSYEGGQLNDVRGAGLGGVSVHRVGATARGRARAAGRLLDWGSYYGLAAARALRLGRFDACLALATPPFIGLVGALLKRRHGTRLVLWTMDLWPDVAVAMRVMRAGGWPAHALRLIAKRLYRAADAIISLGSTMTQRLAALGVDEAKISTVHNWVPGEAVRPLPWGRRYIEGRFPLDGQFVAMYSGNMGTPHEFDTILDAAALLQATPSILFLFVGSGKRRPEVVREAQRRGLGNVGFMEPVRLDRLSELLGSASVHLMSMRPEVEGCIVPSKTYGIMASGRPGIMVGSTDNEAAELFAASGSGWAVETGRSQELARMIRGLRSRPDLARRMGQAGRRYYEQHLRRDRSVATIVDAIVGG